MKFTVFLIDAGTELFLNASSHSSILSLDSVEGQDIQPLLDFLEKYGKDSVSLAIRYDPAGGKADGE